MAAAGATDQQRYSGQALFEGLFLGRGPVAEHHPDLRVPTSGATWTAARSGQLIAAIKQAEPGFFSTFQREITSGDRVRIERATVAADELAARVMAGAPPGTASAYGTFIVVNQTLVVQSNTIWDQTRVWVSTDGSGSALAKETFVNDVAEALLP
ncbi:hypothetical protein [Nonomuraea sp. NPDC002799]